MEEIFDCCVVGAGVVGASIFNKIIRVGKSCLLLDKASDVATGASKANSGLVHAGYDPEPNSLKAKLNVRGNALYKDLCKRLHVPLKNCGALVVGDDLKKIEALHERGIKNGVKTFIWSRDEIIKKVPKIADDVKYALYAPSACLTSPYLLTISLVDEGILNGGKVALEQDIVSVSKQKGIFEIRTKTDVFYAKRIVNSAGAGYNDVAKILQTENYDLEFRRGEYFVFDKSCGLNIPLTVFPLPTKKGKGVLVTPTVDENYLVGPTSEVSDDETKVTSEGLQDIKTKASYCVKDLNFRYAIREFSGIRVICGDDFVIEKSKRTDNVVNLAGICSPGLSSAPAIAEMVLELFEIENKELENLKELPNIKLFKNMSKEEQKKALQKDYRYGQIVCKCERITLADVVNALERPLKISTVDGVKRRTNAGMGRCQGGFCFTKVVRAISQQRNIEYEKVLKENRGSEVAIGDIRAKHEVKHD